MLLSSCCLAGRSALPLEPGDGGHRGMPREPQGQATEPTKSAMDQDRRLRPAQELSWLVDPLAAGGRACHLPSGQIPPPWARWENEAPATRAARRPVPGDSRESYSALFDAAATRGLGSTHRY